MFRVKSFIVGLAVIMPLMAVTPTAQALTIVPGTDTWFTPADGNSQIDLGPAPIPADFFGPGSDPFDRIIELQGIPLQTTPPTTLGPTDLIIERSGTLNVPAEGSVGAVAIEIVALSLQSAGPITVNYDGGTSFELWQVEVYLSGLYSQDLGTMEVTRVCNSGGTFTANFSVKPRFVFTRVDPPYNTGVMDDGVARSLQSSTPGRWASTAPSWANPLQSNGSLMADHDGDPLTPQVTIVAGNNNFFAGLCMEPCEPSPEVELCGGICIARFEGSPYAHSLECLPPVQTGLPIGATCLPDNRCILTTATCASTLGASYAGDGTSCLDTDCTAGLTVAAGTDTWTTPAGAGSNLDMSGDPIPADFFDPGSDPFDGQITVEGVPLETTPSGALGDADLIISRTDPFDRPGIGNTTIVPIELIALSLKSVDPITVTNGTGFDLWDVEVFLSSAYSQTPGYMEVTRSCESGGFFQSTFPVTPRITFTRVDPPHDQRVLDEGLTLPLQSGPSVGWCTETPGWITPNQSNGSVTVDHDGDGGDISSTPEVTIPAGNSDFHTGIRMVPCEPPPDEEICQGMVTADFLGTVDNHDLICLPSVVTSAPHGATCLAPGDCILTTPGCASQLDAYYSSDGAYCWETSDWSTSCPEGTSFGGTRIFVVSRVFGGAQQENTTTGRLEIDVDEAFVYLFPFTGGYMNVYTDMGWVVQNLWLDVNDGVPIVVTYFELSATSGEVIPAISAFVDLSPAPILTATDGPRADYPVLPFVWNAEGIGDIPARVIPDPVSAGSIVFDILGLHTVLTQPNAVNVQAASNQCAPMSLANSLQYLEDRYGLPVPHDHVAGLRGDNSLVGQLDEATDRRAPTRTDGDGIWYTDMVDGKFKYLSDNNLDDRIVHRHQGTGHGGPGNEMPGGDYSSSGVTSTDESVGGQVTWEWICEQIANGEDVEIAITYDSAGIPLGGHAVRVFECGTTFGIPWIGYLHDARQTDQNDPNDLLGLETVRQYMLDSDGDGIPNVGSPDQEIRFAFSESADNDRDGIPDGLDNSPDWYNPGQEDGDGNDIGDVEEGWLESNLIEWPELVAGEVAAFGPFPNPLPSQPEYKDLWFEGIVTTPDIMGCVLAISFDYVIYPDDPVVLPPSSVINIPPGVTWEIFAATQFEFCPDEVSVHIEVLEGGALDLTGSLNHICYPVDFGSSCCDGVRGNANADIEENINISDITYLVDYLFGIPLGPAPECVEEGNANGDIDGNINISDVTYLVDYLFGIPLGPYPPPCPGFDPCLTWGGPWCP